jgi:hypothetical protein
VKLSENVRIAPHLFPRWTIRVYHDSSVPQPYLLELAGRGVQLRTMVLPPNVPIHRKLLWRFELIADPTVQRFLIRDADSLLTVKERVAVDAWLQSRYWFHTMRDWYTHTDLPLAGMRGGVGNVLPGTARLMQAYTAWRMEDNHVDQDVLSEAVWPTIRGHCLIHDSVFPGCLGSVTFPPFGLAPRHAYRAERVHALPANAIAQSSVVSGATTRNRARCAEVDPYSGASTIALRRNKPMSAASV